MADSGVWAAALLQKRAEELDRLPVKSDFDPDVVCRIKNALGPWPRALEKAGLKTAAVRKAAGPHPRKTRQKRANEKNEEETL